MTPVVIHLQRTAPDKPAEGEACNGCGVCCALETCPVARLRFWRKNGPCPALLWCADEANYRCGMLLEPQRFVGVLPRVGEQLVGRLMRRWIAAGQGCDCSAEDERTG